MTEPTDTYALSRPITDKKGDEIAEVTLREPLVKDYMAADKFNMQGQTAYTAALIASVTGVDLETVQRMRIVDLNGIDVALTKLMGNDDGAADGSAPQA